jgi:hydroxymethylcytosylglucuronate/cytosylglucuronate synthase
MKRVGAGSYPGALMVSAFDFGWGGAGKAHLVLSELPGVRTVGVGSSMAKELLGSESFVEWVGESRDEIKDAIERNNVRAGLVIGHMAVASTMTDLGLPVVFVDSLPYLWTEDVDLPVDVDIYCAQMCYALPSLSWPAIRRIRELRWVEAIVPPGRGAVGGSGVVVSVGGLYSVFSTEAGDRYAQCVLPAVLEGILRAGVAVSAVCGNLSPDVCRVVRRMLPRGTHVGAMPPDQFNEVVRRADVLFTSPGSTTMLQADSLGVPVILLPPQNVSQVLNSEWLGSQGADVAKISWPPHTFDISMFTALRPRGEEQALAYMYEVVRGAEADPDVRSHFVDAAERLAGQKLERGGRHIKFFGSRGAHQVAQYVRQMMLAPPRKSNAISVQDT